MKKKLKVDPIKNGTVIDHITAGKAMQVIELLNLNHTKSLMMIGINLSSKKIGKKDIIKIENRVLTDDEVNSIALISPEATLTIIDNFEVVKKRKIHLPEKISKYIICPNPNCVTNIENVTTKFLIKANKAVEVKCEYCEKKYSIEHVKFNF